MWEHKKRSLRPQQKNHVKFVSPWIQVPHQERHARSATRDTVLGRMSGKLTASWTTKAQFAQGNTRFTADHDQWEPRSHLHPETIREFEIENGLYDFEWSHRCPVCDLACNSQRGVHIHQSKAHSSDDKEQDLNGTLADKAVQVSKLKKHQDQRPVITCENELLKNVFTFQYLGTLPVPTALFTADGLHLYDIQSKNRAGLQKMWTITEDLRLSPALSISNYDVYSYWTTDFQNKSTSKLRQTKHRIKSSRDLGKSLRWPMSDTQTHTLSRVRYLKPIRLLPLRCERELSLLPPSSSHFHRDRDRWTKSQVDRLGVPFLIFSHP